MKYIHIASRYVIGTTSVEGNLSPQIKITNSYTSNLVFPL